MLVTRPSPWYIFQPNIKIPSERWDNRGESWKLIIFLDFEPWVEANLRILLMFYKGENQQFSRKLTFVFRSELTSISKCFFLFFRIHSYLSATTYSIFSTVGALCAKRHHKNLQYPPSAGFSNYHPHMRVVIWENIRGEGYWNVHFIKESLQNQFSKIMMPQLLGELIWVSDWLFDFVYIFSFV